MASASEPDVTHQLREAILRGVHMPGERLLESELTERYDSTRGLVRVALVQLEGEGMIERIPNRGARVRRVTLEEAIEITEVRAALEARCAERAAMQGTDEEFAELVVIGEEMRAAVDAEDIVKYSELTQTLHSHITAMARQKTIRSLLTRLRHQSVRVHVRVALLPGRIAYGLEEHLRLIEAITKRDPDLAGQEMASHLESVITELQRLEGDGSGLSPFPFVRN